MNRSRDESGQTLVVVAAFMGLLMMGFLALAIDVGYLFHQKRVAQAAADGAALAAAEESGKQPNDQIVANAMATMNGFDTTVATNPAVVTLTTPTTGNFVGPSYVQATVTMPIHTFFLGTFLPSMVRVPVSATAIAGGGSSSQTCVCLEDNGGNSLNMSNNAKLNAPNCGIVTNSHGSDAVSVVGSAVIDAQSLGVASTSWDKHSLTNINNGGSITNSTQVVTGTAQCAVTMPTAPAYSGCVSNPGGAWGVHFWGPPVGGTICYNGLSVGQNGSVDTLAPGIYVIKNGDLHFYSNGNQGGLGVFFYLTGSSTLTIDNGAPVNLTAGGLNGTTSLGAYDGISIYQDASDASPISIQGGSSTYIHGSIYAPGAPLTLGNGSSNNVQAGIVAKSLTMYGGFILNALAETNEGSLIIGGSPKLVQ